MWSRSSPWLLLLRGAGAALLFAMGPAGSPAAAQVPVAASASTAVVAPGDAVRVTGSGWPDDAEIQAQLCGNQALGGSNDCDLVNTATTATVDGSFGLTLHASVPPRPCPCVIWVSTPVSSDNVRIPIEVTGVPVEATIAPAVSAPRGLELVSARLDRAGGLLSWAGAVPDRTLRLTVENTRTDPQPVDLTVTLTYDGEQPRPLAVPEFEPVDPGERVTLEMPVDLKWAMSEPVVSGSLNVGPNAEGFRVSAVTFPYGLLVALVALVVAAALLPRSKVRSVRSGASRRRS